jgi:hypothetical protein
MRYILHWYLNNHGFILFYYFTIAIDKAFYHYILILKRSKTYNAAVSKITLPGARIIYISIIKG